MTNPDRTAVLHRTLELIQQRGWAVSWSVDNDGPLNIRSAIARACTLLAGADRKSWYQLYLDATHALNAHLKAGLTDWEFAVKAPSEVEQMLAEVINRLENDDIQPRASRSRPRPAGL